MKPGDLRAPKTLDQPYRGYCPAYSVDGRYISLEFNRTGTIVLLYRTSKELERFPQVPFWKCIAGEYGIVFLNEGTLDANFNLVGDSPE